MTRIASGLPKGDGNGLVASRPSVDRHPAQVVIETTWRLFATAALALGASPVAQLEDL